MFFSEKKFRKISGQGRIKKVVLIIQEAQQQLLCGKSVNSSYIKNILNIVEKDISDEWKEPFLSSLSKIPETLTIENLRDLSNLRYALLADIGKEPADWDMDSDMDGIASLLQSKDGEKRTEREVLPINVYLDDLRSPFNVGSIFRTAESFCYENVFLSQHTPSPAHKRAGRSSMGTVELIKWSRAAIEDLPQPVFALETGGISLSDFTFPKSGTVIIGSEEGGISRAAIDTAGKSLGIVSIPLYGIKGSLNVSVAFGILSFCWINKLKT
ncbi:MAG: TrmH family RNA methyltransferase [Spirochaetaceae bacterium]|nr:TrmH family RNA methyltransferase [Spirochaetaceae bacterium]